MGYKDTLYRYIITSINYLAGVIWSVYDNPFTSFGVLYDVGIKSYFSAPYSYYGIVVSYVVWHLNPWIVCLQDNTTKSVYCTQCSDRIM